MIKAEHKKYFPLFLFLFILITRLPFLFNGYGVEEDSWSLALTAHNIHDTGNYEVSRLPGHPLQEYVYSFLWGSGPFVFNLLSALFSALACTSFYLILIRLQVKQAFLAAMAFSFLPIVFISSTYTIDFMWAQGLILLSVYLLLKEQLILSGIILGLAIGCRITSAIMLLPYLILLWKNTNIKKNILDLLKAGLPALFIGSISFIPVYLTYGKAFFDYHDQFPYPSLAKVIYKGSIGVFGLIGILALLISKVKILANRFKKNEESILDKKWIIACWIIVLLVIISYIRLPQKSGYLIAAIPFILLLFYHYLDKKWFSFLCYSLILSSFICSINLTDKKRGAEFSNAAVKWTISGQEVFFDPLNGPLLSDRSKRIRKNNYVKEVLEKMDTIQQPCLIIAGWWYNQIQVSLVRRKPKSFATCVFYADEKKLKEYQAKQYKIYYLPEQDVYNDLMYKMKVTGNMAVLF